MHARRARQYTSRQPTARELDGGASVYYTRYTPHMTWVPKGAPNPPGAPARTLR
jgi:hypothetical protein